MGPGGSPKGCRYPGKRVCAIDDVLGVVMRKVKVG